MGKRVFLLVIDGLGVGASPDAYKYGDEGSNTFLNLYNQRYLDLPTLTKLGLKNIDGIELHHSQNVEGAYARLQEKSAGKDTMTGHFEMMCDISETAMPTYPNGFPNEVIEQLEKAWGKEIIGNCVASGTEIIKQLGQEHLETKKPIVYTSADSVLQIATHTDIYSLNELYNFCEKARKIMSGKHAVGRVIARPFKTENGQFVRLNTARRDYALSPAKPNTMSRLVENGYDVIAVGKIGDIFNHESITKTYENHTNTESIEITKTLSTQKFNGLCFVNLVDTDMLYGHRNDIEGYAQSLEQTDKAIEYIISNLNENDFIIITGDHGNDPTTTSTDHSREYTPLLVYSKNLNCSINLGTLNGFDSIGKFVEKLFGLNANSVIYDAIFTKEQ